MAARRQRARFSGLHASARLATAIIAGVAVLLVLPSAGGTGLHFLAGWDVAAAIYLGLAWRVIVKSDPRETRTRARTQDIGAFLILVSILVASFASVAAITLLLEGVKDLPPLPKTLHVALSFVALLLSWFLIHTLYSFHYARKYYESKSEREPESRGLTFPGTENPDYFDFAYYSFVVGMTAQVSDVCVNAHHMRRLTLAHSVVSFIFNMAILALSINIFVAVI